MTDLPRHLQELADAAARHGTVPGPAAAIRRGRRRRRRIAAAAVVALAVALAAGTGAVGELIGQPDLPATAPATTLPPPPALNFRADWPAPPPETKAALTLERGVHRCPGGLTPRGNLIGYFRSAQFRRLVVMGGKPPASDETTVCWAVGAFALDGSGTLSRPVEPVPIATRLTANVEGSATYGMIYGQVDKRTVRVRVRFRDRPSPSDVPVVHTLQTYEVNLYVGLFPPGWVPVQVTAFDATDRQLAGCALQPSAGTAALPRCPSR